MANLRLVDPLPYLDFVQLMANARCVLTDSGGIQEETTALGVPCLILRENTERPITVSRGTNRVIGVEPAAIYAHWRRAADGQWPKGELPELWDGHARYIFTRPLAESHLTQRLFGQILGPFKRLAWLRPDGRYAATNGFPERCPERHREHEFPLDSR